MKKIVLVSLAFLFVLVGCGQKKETGTATKTEKDTLQSALPVIENAEKNTVVTKTLVLPKSDDCLLYTSRFVDDGNTVLVIEHNLDVIKTADHIIDLGPEGGVGGGTIIATGTPEEVAANEASYTGHYLKGKLKHE